MVTADLDPRSRHGRDVDLVRKTAERAATLTRQLLAFSRKQVLQPCALDFNVVVEDIVPMLRRLIGEDIELMVRLRPDVGYVMADPSQLEQVIMNLVVNARDAMPDGGRLTIETGTAELDAAYVRRHPGSRAGMHVVLAISDTASAWTPRRRRDLRAVLHARSRKGSGLGWPRLGIIKQSGGTVWVYASRQGPPSSSLPAQAETLARRGGPRSRASHPRGSETSSSSRIRRSPRARARHSRAARLHVLDERDSASRGSLRGEPRSDRMLLTDFVMPGPSGRVLADRVRARGRCEGPIHVRYTDQAIVHHACWTRHRVSSEHFASTR